MRDVAQEAGVSTALVSIVVRGAVGASEATRGRVLDAAQRIGYVRDERARLLRARRSMDIGVCFETQQPFHHKLLDVMYAAVVSTEHSIVLSAVTPSRGEGAALHDLVAYRCGAIISLGSRLPSQELSEVASGIPLVVANRSMGQELDWVSSDDEQGIALAVEHLVELGHRDVVFATSAGAAGADERNEGFTAAAEKSGAIGEIVEGGSTEVSGAELAVALLERDELPSGVIAFNDRSALGMLDVFVRRGVRVPHDISVVGYDDSEIAGRSYVQLTTIAQDTQAMGQAAVELAVSRIVDEFEGGVRPREVGLAPGASETSFPRRSPEVSSLRIPTTLVVRMTTGPPRSA